MKPAKRSRSQQRRVQLWSLSEKIKEKLENARMKFDMATDESLIDCYIYEISSLNSKYQYYLKKAKKSGLTAEGFDEVTAEGG